jgi:hypothetical protein
MFARVTNYVSSAVRDSGIDDQLLQRSQRLVVRFARTPTDNELLCLHQGLPRAVDGGCATEIPPATVCIGSMGEVLDRSSGSPQCLARIPTTPVPLNDHLVYCALYPWQSIQTRRLQSQRKLLREARLKLKGMPPDAVGMICMRTHATSHFAKEVHRLIDKPSFARTPIVWLNPNDLPSRVIFRDDARLLVQKLFGQ